MPYRADGMNHVARGQLIAAGDLGLAGRAALKRSALGEEIGSGRAMDGAVDTAAAQQRSIGGVDDGVDGKPGDVADDDFETGAVRLGGAIRRFHSADCMSIARGSSSLRRAAFAYRACSGGRARKNAS